MYVCCNRCLLSAWTVRTSRLGPATDHLFFRSLSSRPDPIHLCPAPQLRERAGAGTSAPTSPEPATPWLSAAEKATANKPPASKILRVGGAGFAAAGGERVAAELRGRPGSVEDRRRSSFGEGRAAAGGGGWRSGRWRSRRNGCVRGGAAAALFVFSGGEGFCNPFVATANHPDALESSVPARR
jgi:hypothetical protein